MKENQIVEAVEQSKAEPVSGMTMEERCRQIYQELDVMSPFEFYLEFCYELWSEAADAAEIENPGFEAWKRMPHELLRIEKPAA